MDELAAMNNGESGIAPQVSHVKYVVFATQIELNRYCRMTKNLESMEGKYLIML